MHFFKYNENAKFILTCVTTKSKLSFNAKVLSDAVEFNTDENPFEFETIMNHFSQDVY